MTISLAIPDFVTSIQHAPILIEGTNFINSVYCSFGGELVPATIINVNNLFCTSPDRHPGEVILQVTRNFIEYFGDFLFTFRDPVSPYCRGYQGQYPFLSKTQERQGGNISNGDPLYFPENVAFAQNVTITQGTAYYFNASQVVNNDFCCNLPGSYEGQGFICGANFSSPSFENELLLSLNTAAQVNQVVLAWGDPCQFMPPSYILSYSMNVTGPFIVLLERNTTYSDSCVYIPSDNGASALCINFFTPLTAQYFKLDFNTTGLLYEFAIHGIYLNEAYTITTGSPTWISGAIVTSSLNSSFPFFQIQLENVLNKTLASTPYNYLIEIQLYQLTSNGYVNVTNQLIGNLFEYTNTTNMFSNLILSKPIAGSYQIIFNSSNLNPLTLNFDVVAGIASQLFSPTNLPLLPTGNVVPLGDIEICVADEVGNNATSISTVFLNITTAGGVSYNFSGSHQANLNGSCTTFTNISLSLPPLGNYIMTFTSSLPSIQSYSFPFQVIEGPPSILIPTSLPANVYDNIAPFSIQPSFTVTDAAGNLINSYSQIYLGVQVLSINNSGVATINGPYEVLIIEGRTGWTNLGITGVYGDSYILHYYIVSSPNVYYEQTISIRSCSQIISKANTIQSPDGYSCNCDVGFGYNSTSDRCTPCASGYYKNVVANVPCLQCLGLTDTNGQLQSTSCVCKQGYYEVSGGCLPCPQGGVCENNKITGILPGYWIPPGSEFLTFYPCHPINPTSQDLQAANLACPGNASSLASTCGEGYTGIECLQCSPGYGAQGPFCDPCPSPGVNYTILGIALILLIAGFIFLVIQGSKPKNKEAVSFRIFLNHIQMLALLSASGISWTDPFQTILVIFTFLTFFDSRIVATDCAAPVGFYYKYAFYSFFPLISLFLVGLVYLFFILILKIVKKEVNIKSTLSHFCLALVIITFIAYPAICVKVMEIYDCSIEVNGVKYLSESPSDACSGSTYGFWVTIGTLNLILYCIGAPLAGLILLYKYHDVNNSFMELILQFFWDGFKPQKYYWEITILFRKFLLSIIIIVARASGLLIQIYSFFIVIQVALFIHIVFRPYVSARQFRLELWSLLAVLITLGAALFVPRLQQGSAGAYASSAIVSIVNIVVIITFVVIIIRGLWKKLLPNSYEKVADFFLKCVPSRFIGEEYEVQEVKGFFQSYINSSAYDKRKMLENVAKLWSELAPYQRRRMMQMFIDISRGTEFEGFQNRVPKSENTNDIELKEDSQSKD